MSEQLGRSAIRLRTGHRARSRGLAIASVLAAMLVGLSLWAISYRHLSGQIQLEEQIATVGPTGLPPDWAAALAIRISCLRVSVPSTFPYECIVTLGLGAHRSKYYTKLDDKPSHPGEYELTVEIYDPTKADHLKASACDACAGGAL